MKAEEYRMTQDHIFLLAAMARTLPVPEFIEAIDKAESLGPVLDPTLYIKGADRMAKVRKIAAAVLELKRTADEVFAEEVAVQQKNGGRG